MLDVQAELFRQNGAFVYSLVRRYIKTAIAFLGVGLVLGGWMLVRRELHGIPPTVYETSAHTHVLFVGFVTEMILGVALWLFPRPHRDDARYSPRVAEAAYWLLTIGTVARVAGELARDGVDGLALRGPSFAQGLPRLRASVCSFTPCGRESVPLGASRARQQASDSELRASSFDDFTSRLLHSDRTMGSDNVRR